MARCSCCWGVNHALSKCKERTDASEAEDHGRDAASPKRTHLGQSSGTCSVAHARRDAHSQKTRDSYNHTRKQCSKKHLNLDATTVTPHLQACCTNTLPSSTLYLQACCTFDHVVPSCMLYLQACCTFGHAAPSGMLKIRACCTFGHVVHAHESKASHEMNTNSFRNGHRLVVGWAMARREVKQQAHWTNQGKKMSLGEEN